MSLEFFSGLIGLLVTLLIFSYLLNDNPLFRMTIYLFIGIASGYAAAVVWQYVLAPKVLIVLQSTDPNLWLLTVIPLFFGATLLAKLFPKLSWLGSFGMALLVGVGAATALGGALLGTLMPQVGAAINALDFRSAEGGTGGAFAKLLEGAVMLVGTVLTLGYFQFTASRAPDGTPKRNAAFEVVAWAGRFFIALTFGVIFAGVYMAALTAMIERLTTIINFIRQLIGF